jgi:opacity protein-like surface antigen
MRSFLLLMVLMAAPAVSFAQAFADGNNLIYLGFGLPPGTRLTPQDEGLAPNFTDHKLQNYGTGILRYEHGLHKYFGIGLNFEYSGAQDVYSYGNTSSNTYNITINRTVIGGYLRLNGHYPIGDKVDIYGGVGLGYLYTLDNTNDTNPNANLNTSHKKSVLDFDYQASLGIRFMVKQGFGVFAEVGYATTACQVGVVLKF